MIDEAEKSFLNATEKDPNSFLPYYNLGYLNQKYFLNLNNAVKYYKQAIDRNDKADSAIFNAA